MMQKARKLIFLMSLSIILVSCSSAVESISDEASIQTEKPEATLESTPEPIAKPTAEVTPEGTVNTTPEATPEAIPESTDGQKHYFADNKYIVAFLREFSKLAPELDLSFDLGGYSFTDNNITSTPEGRISNVGDYYENNEVMIGLGYNMDNENMWYVSFEAPLPKLSEWFNKYYFATILALNNNPISMGDNQEQLTEFMNTLYSTLIADENDKAIQRGDYVFVFKNTTENRAVFAVDTISYFNAFYKGTIDLTTLK